MPNDADTPSTSNSNSSNSNNPLATLWSSLVPSFPNQPVETEEDRIKRLKEERLAELSEGEIRRV